MTILGCILGVLTGLAPLAEPTQVHRDSVTLGALTRTADRIVFAYVSTVDDHQVVLDIDSTVLGEDVSKLYLPRAHVTRWQPGERCLLLLEDSANGLVKPLVTPWQKIPAPDATAASTLEAAVHSRLLPPGTHRDDALIQQLAWPHERLSDDAAIDLRRGGAPKTERTRTQLATALRQRTSIPLLELAADLADAELLSPTLRAAYRSSDKPTVMAAAAALNRIAPDLAIASLATDLDSNDQQRGKRAVVILAFMGSNESLACLFDLLSQASPALHEASLRAITEVGPTVDIAPTAIEALAWGDNNHTARLALAALARLGAGKELARAARDHPDPDLRQLAARLRRDPVTVARQLLKD